MNHRQIVGIVSGIPGVGPWWQQMVTVGYEQARGLRQKHEKPDGFQISRSKTIAAPVADAFRALRDAKLRAQWLPGGKTRIRKATASKSIRAAWDRDGSATAIEVSFLRKGPGKTQVTVQHSKLPGAAEAARMKTYWGKNLDRLQAMLEE